MSVIVGVDGSPGSIDAIRFAVSEAALHSWKVEAILVWGPGEAFHADQAGADDALARLIAEAAGPSVSDVACRAVVGVAHDELLEAAVGADLLVVGSTGHRGFSRLLLGSVAEVCLRHAPCPVVVARPMSSPGGRVVVGVDGSPGSVAALHAAAAEARLRDATLQVVHAFRAPLLSAYPYVTAEFDVAPWRRAAQHVLDQAMYRLGRDGRARASASIVEGGAASALVSAGAGADLVVVGSRGLGGFARLRLGSVSHQVASHAPGSVLVVPTGET